MNIKYKLTLKKASIMSNNIEKNIAEVSKELKSHSILVSPLYHKIIWNKILELVKMKIRLKAVQLLLLLYIV